MSDRKAVNSGMDWKDLKKQADQKKVIIYGLSENLFSYFGQYGDELKISAVIDGDKRKEGLRVKQLVGCLSTTSIGDMIVSGFNILDSFAPEDTVVIVGGRRAYVDIVEKLRKKGFVETFIVEMLDGREEKFVQKQIDYARECMQKEIDDKKIVILMGYNGEHGRYITERLLEIETDIHICWILRTQKKAEFGIDIVYEGDWKRYIYEMETAKVWIMDEPVPEYIYKRPEQIYIQTKHWGSITLKKFYFDVDGRTERKLHKLQHGFAGIDYVFVGSDFDEKSCRTGFHYSGDCIRIGSPRSDAMFDIFAKSRIEEYYGLSEATKIVLYAPTYREVQKRNNKAEYRWNDLNIQDVRKKISEKFGGEWVVLLHLHPLDVAYVQGVELEDGIIDASLYENGQELVAAADLMITDYSSIMFEPALVGTPVFLYAPDRKEYINNERGLLIEYDTLPFPISETQDELLNEISDFDLVEYMGKVKSFLAYYGVNEDGNASKRAAEFILEIMRV